MIIRRGGGKLSVAGPSNSLAQGKGPGTQHGYSSGNSVANGTNSGIDQLSHGLASTSLAYNQDGDWEVSTKKTTIRGYAQQGAPQNFTPNMCRGNGLRKLGMGGAACNGKSAGGAWRTQVADPRRANGGAANSQPYNRSLVNNAPRTAVAPPLQDEWEWGDTAGAHVTPGQGSGGPYDSVLDAGDQQHQGDVDDYDYRPDHDYDYLIWDTAGAHVTVHVTPGQGSGGPYDSVLDAGDQQHQGDVDDYDYLMWEEHDEDAGLREIVSDKDIVWPPMVVVMNTQLQMDENDEKIGMSNEELVDSFRAYTKAVTACHSYEPKGHRGMSILIFESSPVGYWEAENLDKYFTEQSIGIWDHHGSLRRQLRGYMARKEDVDNFNKHCQGKKKLKFEVKSYQEMVVVPMRQMSEDNQQLVSLKNMVVEEQMHSKALEESLSIMAQKLRRTEEENRIVRERTKVQHEQNKEEMDSQEQFFKEQISILNQTLEENEKAFAEKLQEERTKVKLSTVGLTAAEDDKLRKEEADEFIQIQAKRIKEFEAKREKLIKKYLKLENKIKDDLAKLMEYTPTPSEESGLPTIEI